MPTILVLAMALLVHATATADPALRFRLRGEHDVIVPVTLDGHGPFHFLLDTGSSRSAITRGLADRLGLELAGSTRMVTPSGGRSTPLTRVSRVKLGGVVASDILVMVLRDEDLGARGSVDGLIGQDVFARTVFTIDYRRRALVWERAPAGGIDPGVRLPLSSDSGGLLVELPQAGSLPPLRLVPDSGADSLVLFETVDSTAQAMTPLDAIGWRTLSGLRVARRVLVNALDVGVIRLRDQRALLVPRPGTTGEDAGRLGDGLLPLHLFERVTFDLVSGCLAVRGRRP